MLRTSVNLITIPLALATGAGHTYGLLAFFAVLPLATLACALLAALEHESEAQ